MTKQEAIEKTMRWLDEATLNGVATPTDQLADLKDRAAYLLDDAVQHITAIFKIPAVYSIIRTPAQNLIGKDFLMEEIGQGKTYSVTAEACSFYIETSGNVTITFVQNGETLKVLTAESEAFTASKGNIGNIAGKVTMTVSSDFPFVVRYPALYPYSYRNDDNVPDYIPFVPYDMPADFREYDGVYQSSDFITFREFPDVRRVGSKTYLLPYYARGQFDFRYWRSAQTVPYNADGDTVLDVDSAAEQLVPLKLACDLTVGDDETLALSYWLTDRFNTELMTIRAENKGGMKPVQTVYGVDW